MTRSAAALHMFDTVQQPYPTHLKEQGFKEPLDYLKSDASIFQLIEELSATPWEPPQ
ncbi:MAG TPA: hypothetical protein VJP86_08640 [Vicinamibacterales bacterium]|nr:hypothetical protein [Vicinamibacterales bacterium]